MHRQVCPGTQVPLAWSLLPLSPSRPHTCVYVLTRFGRLRKKLFWNLPDFEGPRAGSSTCYGEMGGLKQASPGNTFQSHELQGWARSHS